MMTAPKRRAAPRAVALAIALAALAAAADPAIALDPPACAAQRPAAVPIARLAVLARGFNLTSWLDGASPRRPDMALLGKLHARGFTHVRLPVTAERLMEAFSTPEEIARQSAELDRAIDRLLAIGFGVSLDMHPGSQFADLYAAEPKRAFDLLEALWRRLARRYADRPADRLFFEVLNEPTVTPRIWNADGPRLVDAIRREAPDHTIIYGGAGYQRIDALDGVRPVADANVVYAVHFYDPMVFTHQGLDWAADDPLRFIENMPFPAQLSDPAVARLLKNLTMEGRAAAAAKVMIQLHQPWTEERIDAEFANAQAWAGRQRAAMIVNEFGVLSWRAPPAARVRWLAAVRRAAERHCIGWAHWDYADGFGFVHRFEDGRERADEAVVGALLDRP
jgi:endoglucanase